MSEDERMSEEIRLAALAIHIGEALKREDLPPLDAQKFQAHLARVHAARERLAAEVVKVG